MTPRAIGWPSVVSRASEVSCYLFPGLCLCQLLFLQQSWRGEDTEEGSGNCDLLSVPLPLLWASKGGSHSPCTEQLTYSVWSDATAAGGRNAFPPTLSYHASQLLFLFFLKQWPVTCCVFQSQLLRCRAQQGPLAVCISEVTFEDPRCVCGGGKVFSFS